MCILSKHSCVSCMTHPDQRLSLVPPKNQLVLEGRRSQSSEDVPKFTNVTFTLPDKSWGCEYHVSRLQCTRPDLTISDSQGLFEDVSGTSVCNQTKGSILANRFQPDFCYVLKNPLHVGETLDFELHATSVFRGEKGDSVDIQAAPEPGIPVGMQFLEQQVQLNDMSAHARYKTITESEPRLLQRVSLSDLASFLGMRKETLSRVRGKI